MVSSPGAWIRHLSRHAASNNIIGAAFTLRVNLTMIVPTGMHVHNRDQQATAPGLLLGARSPLTIILPGGMKALEQLLPPAGGLMLGFVEVTALAKVHSSLP
jgi:hypothetical protein